ncbi:MAG: orotate phosphoribosyltransferase [Pseudomonadota bacterium]
MIPTSHPDDATIARLTAAMLWEADAVAFRPSDPFILASGLPSPTYVDCRRLVSFPRIRTTLMDFLATKILREAGFEAFTNVAGGETAGIPFAAFLAERLVLPMTYIRKKPKGYGKNARVEGVMGPSDRVLLVEDLATDGGSKLSFVEAIRDTGAECRHTAVVFFYDIFPEARAALAQHDVQLTALCTWADVLAEARRREGFDAATLDEVAAFLSDPRAWQDTRG